LKFHIEIFPEEKKNFSRLTEIIINHSKINFEDINNEAFSNINELVKLDLNYNNITSLPSKLGSLKNLRYQKIK